MAATGLPPPPVKANSGDFAWVAWQQAIYKLLSTAGSVSWTLVDKAGSKLNDLQARPHNQLQGVAGTGEYHLSQAEQQRVTATVALNSKADAPTTSDIPSGKWALYKNTTTNKVFLYVNDGGTLKSVELV